MTKQRALSNLGIYHVVVKGNNKNDIFCDEEDNLKFLYMLKDQQELGRLSCYAYCLMVNHAHLLLRFKEENISEVMTSLMLRYVKWYNKKYERTGRLFEDRFFSNPVMNQRHFLAGLQYIYNNPVKAGLSESAIGYRWSSYKNLLISDSDSPLKTPSMNKMPIREELLSVLDNKLDTREWEPRERIHDTEAMELLMTKLNLKEWREIQSLGKERLGLGVELLRASGANVNQISRVLGVSRYNIKKLM